jgi:hypothetical protein
VGSPRSFRVDVLRVKKSVFLLGFLLNQDLALGLTIAPKLRPLIG